MCKDVVLPSSFASLAPETQDTQGDAEKAHLYFEDIFSYQRMLEVRTKDSVCYNPILHSLVSCVEYQLYESAC